MKERKDSIMIYVEMERNMTQQKGMSRMSYVNEIAKEIRNARHYQRLKLREVANQSGLSVGFICDIEKGRKNPSLDSICRIQKALKLGDKLERLYAQEQQIEESTIKMMKDLNEVRYINDENAKRAKISVIIDDLVNGKYNL